MNTNSNLELNNIQFRKIKSLDFLYEISEDGRIFRNVKSKKILRQCKTYRGYWIVSVSIKGTRIYRTVHSLVAECWLGDKPDGYEIDHIDRNPDNNNYRNLRYVTHSENNLNRNMSWKVSVSIKYINAVNWLSFDNLNSCAEYISNTVDKPFKTVRWKLSKRRHHIFGFDIKYI